MKTFLKTIGTLAAVATMCLATAAVTQAKDYKVAFIARAQAEFFRRLAGERHHGRGEEIPGHQARRDGLSG